MIANDFGLDFERIRAGTHPGLPAGRRHARRRVRRRAVPVQGHDAAGGVQRQQLPRSATRRCSSTRACRSTSSAASSSGSTSSTMTVGILGMAFKAESDDIRSSLSYKLKRILRFKARRVLCTDPYVTTDPTSCRSSEVLAAADLLVIAAPHTRVPRPGHRQAGRRHLEPARQRGARVNGPRRESRSSSRLQRGRRHRAGARSALRGGHAALRGARRRRLRRTTPPCPCVEKYARERAAAARRRQHLRPGPGERDPLRHRRRGRARRRRHHGRRLRRPPPDRRPRPARRARRGRRGRLALHARRPAGRRPAAQGRPLRAARAARCYWFARVGTRDATNSFKAYSTETSCARSASTADDGFEIGLELVAKARRLRLPVAEIPTIWLDRTPASSNFKIAAWMPKYLRWYRIAFGPTLDRSRSVDRRQRRQRREYRCRRSSSPARPASSAATSSRSCCAAATTSSASTTSPSTARSRSPTTTTPTTGSSRATPATST